MLQAIDESVLHFLNGFANRSTALDMIIVRGFQMPSVRFLPLMTCIVWLWFDAGTYWKPRFLLLQGLPGTLLAPFTSRAIQSLSPHRPRPMHVEELNLAMPGGVSRDQLHEWSSFPSDNAALAFAIATTVWRVSRPLSLACFAWALFVVAMPRVYAGYHYPSDIAGGAIIGILSVLVCAKLTTTMSALNRIGSLEQRSPGLFYSVCFVTMFYITTMFEDIRRIGSRLAELL
ncbi:phosphatase PAP2 family protein [Microvirga roseola]|uniref:phosphatase PAP2 family protein n=1 Tax=Microvirga roseola TaxID=2883126 RepID=UPI001E3FCF6D|nr:phosphatase PAP2 family protein [Microvirga roseola]